jgi:beta-N-acetylhexosaminidase
MLSSTNAKQILKDSFPLHIKHCLKTVLLLLGLSLSSSLLRAQVPEFWYDHQLKQMSIDQKIGQLFMVAAYSNKGEQHTEEIENLVRNYHIGGLIFFQDDVMKQAYLSNYYQSMASTPLMIGIDGEWGLSMRLKNTLKFPYAITLGALKNDSLCFEVGAAIARQCKRLGIQINFAPVVDVNVNPKNPIIGFRAFGDDKRRVAILGNAYNQGMLSEQVLSSAKHFPGHGDVHTDSHHDLPVVDKSYAELDTTEFYPFKYLIDKGVSSIMVAHIHYPQLDSRPNRSASLSKYIIDTILRQKLNFEGLIFTDALNMKGVSKYYSAGHADLEAFLAGNDILLFSENVPVATSLIKQAIEDGRISEDELNRRVLRILKYKNYAGLNAYKPIVTKHLNNDLNNDDNDNLLQAVANHTVGIVADSKGYLPIKKKQETLFLALGDERESSWEKVLSKHGLNNYIQVTKNPSSEKIAELIRKASSYKKVVISLHNSTIWSQQTGGYTPNDFNLIARMGREKALTVIAFCNPYVIKNLPKDIGIIAGYEDEKYYHNTTVEILLGLRTGVGELPIDLGFPKYIKPVAPKPEKTFKNLGMLDGIDPIAKQLLDKKGAPGCRVLVLKDGQEVFNRSYGYLNYDKQNKVNDSTVYDLASITKISATTLAVMKLYEQGKLDIDKTLGDYLPQARGTNKSKLVLSDILQHRAGLTAWIPFYKETLPYIDSVFCKIEDSAYCVKVADKLFMLQANRDTIYKRIFDSELESKKYRYSDLSMMLMQLVVEQVSQQSLDSFVGENFYRPMGLKSIGYNPWKKGNTDNIAPTQMDRLFRQQKLCGYVHDPAAAMLGGVSGHAGVFSNCRDLAELMEMLLDSGIYNGKRYLEYTTIKKFTATQRSDSRRGLGFDKTDLTGRISPASTLGSSKMFGHTGFTGTSTWVDPDYGLVFVFLSNRICPEEENRELISGNYRTRIQDIVYRWVKTLD